KKFSSGQTTYWVCVNENCKGKVNLLNGAIVRQSDHCHEPETSKLASIQQKNNAKEIAGQSEYCNVKSAYNDATNAVLASSTLPLDEVLSGLKTFGQLKGTINRVRASRFPSLPKSRSEIDIPTGLQFSGDEKFFQVDDGNEDKILVFATNAFLHHLCSSGHVYADGTFKSVPHLFASLYTLHVMVNSMMVPVVYALLPDSTMATYVRLFRIIQDMCCKLDLTWRPTQFTTDFELATIKAINLIFPACELKCCLFHFSQSLWRNVGKHGLVERYKANVDNVKSTVKRISALPVIAISDIETTYTQIKIEAPDDLAMHHS
ncbi:uncharacterized protein LOC107370495, partial [Tetranychus urticae]|uniref:uncharacterized protein LOC107370495 n=1 Tax=Tetranychus urticae TaxID=32264 RepID=UPI00077BCE64